MLSEESNWCGVFAEYYKSTGLKLRACKRTNLLKTEYDCLAERVTRQIYNKFALLLLVPDSIGF